MNYFKNDNNKIFAYDDGQVKQGFGKDLTPVTETEMQSFKLFGVWDKTQTEIDGKVAELEAQAKVDNALKDLQDLCDTKSQEAKSYINGAKVTNEQLSRYEEKYEIAKEYKSSGAYQEQLQLEADLVGLSVDDLADLIIEKGDAYKQSLIVFNARIEAFRVKVKSIIEAGDIDRANIIIEKARDLGADATDDDVKALFE